MTDELGVEDEREAEHSPPADEPPAETPLQTQITLNSVLGIDNPKTLKIPGKVAGVEVVVMIDPGATHNFVSTETVKKLRLPVTHNRAFGETLGTGDAVQGQGECKSMELQLPGLTITEDFSILPLGNADVILGIQWLEKLGTMTTN